MKDIEALKLAGINWLEIGLHWNKENRAEMGIFEKLSEMKDIEALKLAFEFGIRGIYSDFWLFFWNTESID